jgi:hypothetical protein
VSGVAVIALGAFLLARRGILNTEMIWPGAREAYLMDSVFPLAAAFLLATVGIHLMSMGCAAAGRVTLLRVGLAIGAVLPVSVVTVMLVPARGGETDLVHSVKMGYPMFWVNLLIGWALWPLGGPGQSAENRGGRGTR